MKKYKINEKEYELIENYKDGFDLESITEKMTDFFDAYDYIVGDWAYGKLRLKGFCNKKNKIFKNINNHENIKDYIKNDCAYECKYFVLQKVEKEN